jgi:hypothetical protein
MARHAHLRRLGSGSRVCRGARRRVARDCRLGRPLPHR